MIRRFDEEAAIATDTYIDLLLDRRPTPAVAGDDLVQRRLRKTIDLLHGGLPRFHPSFAFEEQLAERLRAADSNRPPADVVRLSLHSRRAALASAGVDRRMLLGGAAIAASGFSMAAVYAWRQAARRARVARMGREVPA